MCGEEVTPQSPEMQAFAPAPTIGQLSADAGAANRANFESAMPLLDQYGQKMTDIQGAQAPQMLQHFIQNQRVGGPALIGLALDRVKQADPSGFKLRESLMERVAGNLSLGGNLNPDEQRHMTEDFRQAQVNRGFGTGQSDALDETAFLASQRFAREQARVANALQVLSGRNPLDQMGQVQSMTPFGAPDVSGMAGNLIPSTGQMMGFGMQGAGMNANNINAANQMKQHQAQWQHANTSNPLQEDIMFGLQVGQGLGQIAGGAAGAAMGNPMAGMGAMGGASNLAGAFGGGGGGTGGFNPQMKSPTMSWNQPYYG